MLDLRPAAAELRQAAAATTGAFRDLADLVAQVKISQRNTAKRLRTLQAKLGPHLRTRLRETIAERQSAVGSKWAPAKQRRIA